VDIFRKKLDWPVRPAYRPVRRLRSNLAGVPTRARECRFVRVIRLLDVFWTRTVLTPKIAMTSVFPLDAVRATLTVCLSAGFGAMGYQRRQHGGDSAWQAGRTNAAPKP
jgi:hypothetical protein